MNLNDYMDTWSGYTESVNEAASKRDGKLEKLDGYRGERADKEREEITREFNEAVEVARTEAHAKFNATLKAMKEKADKIDEVMVAPTADMVNALKALEMRTSITAREANSAAKLMEGCDVALDALQDLCTARGGVRVSKRGKSARAKAYDHLHSFNEAAGMLLSWRGGSRSELMRKRSEEFYAHASERTPIGAALVADIRTDNVADFAKAIVGDDASLSDVLRLD